MPQARRNRVLSCRLARIEGWQNLNLTVSLCYQFAKCAAFINPRSCDRSSERLYRGTDGRHQLRAFAAPDRSGQGERLLIQSRLLS